MEGAGVTRGGKGGAPRAPAETLISEVEGWGMMTKSPVELGVTAREVAPGYAEVADEPEPVPFAEACDVDLERKAGGNDGGAWSLVVGFVGE